AFTMAEILLSLTIIGVVAAITLPSLTGNINERTWNTQCKALYARFSQAIALMPALNGYGVNDNASTTENQAAETFLTAGLSKVLKINNICNHENLEDCGLPTKVTGINGSITFSAFPTQLSDLNSLLYGGAYTQANGTVNSDPNATLNTKVAAFETQNGESIALFYNPNCRANMQEKMTYSQSKVCANFIYDLNGSKGPNTVGKDIGVITVLYPSDSVVVAPVPTIRDITQVQHNEAGRKCAEADSESRIPNLAEMVSVFYNQKLFGLAFYGSYCYWTSDLWENGEARALNMSTGYWDTHVRTDSRTVRCVKR
ncbi:MAG: type II secretion system GspH family protein, partial [Fusobacterium sp.]|nr:type II secretion system GspH family protein [Fusobacterium sp.]